MTANPRHQTAGAPRDILERQPPSNVEAERDVLGAVLIDPQCFDDLATTLRAEDFYDGAHQRIFEYMLKLSVAGKRIDVTLLVDLLRRDGHYESVGGMAYLGELVNSVPHAVSAPHYAEIVRQHALRRAMIHASVDNLGDGYDLTLDARKALEVAESRLFAIGDRDTSVASRSAAELLQNALARISDRVNGSAVQGTPTGFIDLDQMTGGLAAGQLVILAARPSMGKSALALNIAEHVAVDHGTGALLVSLEMNADELTDRMLCSVARVNSQRVRDGSLNSDDRAKLVEAAAVVSNAPLWIDDAPSRSMTQIAALARRHQRRNELGLLVIDYLQLIEPEDPRDPRQEQVAKIARRLKTLARELRVPVLCLAQLNRQTEAVRDNRPRLSHLRESGAIEQDADVVLFIHRDEYYATTEEERTKKRGQADLIVAKQRSGPCGDVKLTWLANYTRFENAASDYEGFTEEGQPAKPSPSRGSYSNRKDLF